MKAWRIASLALLTLLSALLLWAGDPWKEKPWMEWTQKDVDKVLQDSPWAQGYLKAKESQPEFDPSLSAEQRNTQRSTQVTDAYFTVVWESARTVKEAEARLSQLQTTGKEEGDDWELGIPKDYVIWVAGYVYEGRYLTELTDFQRLSEEEKRKVALLELKQSKKKVYPMKVEMKFGQTAAGGGRVGRYVDARFYFPREVDGQPLLGPAEKKVTFRWLLERLPVTGDFDLRKMVRDGQPDL